MAKLERTKPEGVKKQSLLDFLNQKASEKKETHRLFLYTNEIEYLANLVSFDIEVVDCLCDIIDEKNKEDITDNFKEEEFNY